MSKLSSQEMYLYDLFYFDSKSKLNEYSRKTNEYIFFISHIYFRDLNITYVVRITTGLLSKNHMQKL